MLVARAAFLFLLLGIVGSIACSDDPDVYSVNELKALPEASLIVPDGEVVRTVERPGTNTPEHSNISIDIRTDLTPQAVLEFYRERLSAAGWKFADVAPQDALVKGQGSKGDFAIVITVADRENARGTTDWGNRRTVYQVLVLAKEGTEPLKTRWSFAPSPVSQVVADGSGRQPAVRFRSHVSPSFLLDCSLFRVG